MSRTLGLRRTAIGHAAVVATLFGAQSARSQSEEGRAATEKGSPGEQNALAAMETQHGSPVVLDAVERLRDGRVAFWALGADREVDSADLNVQLRERGYSTPSRVMRFGGIGLSMYKYPWHVTGLVEVGVSTFDSPRGASGHLDVWSFEMQGGWGTLRVGPLDIAPFVGLGTATYAFRASRRAGDPVPWSGAPSDERVPRKTTPFIDFGLMATTIVPVGGRRIGPSVGVQAGYLVSFAEIPWGVSTGTARVESGPSFALQGVFARLLAGIAVDLVHVHHKARRVPSCTGHNCYLACDEGYLDCDGQRRNGCETPRGIHNCGGCGDRCELSRADAVCAPEQEDHTIPSGEIRHLPKDPEHDDEYSCALASCHDGYANCNGRYSDGCETFVSADRHHCGACGHACAPGERCIGGECV